jgi:hypothetical protein
MTSPLLTDDDRALLEGYGANVLAWVEQAFMAAGARLVGGDRLSRRFREAMAAVGGLWKRSPQAPRLACHLLKDLREFRVRLDPIFDGVELSVRSWADCQSAAARVEWPALRVY